MKEKFKISLLNNGIHSFNKGLDELIAYEKSGNKNSFQLKESIMFLHHGIELLLKQILINEGGEYLIFDNINSDTLKKIIKAKKQNVSVFELEKPVHTTTYLEAIQRIKAFIDSPKLEESLETRLIQLNTLRNNIEHYGIDTEKSKVENLLLKLHKPISKFFLDTGIILGNENEKKWIELERQLLIEVSRLRGGGSIKKAELIENYASIEYVANYEEYKQLQPQSNVTEELLSAYWEGSGILRALNDGSIRLMRKLYDIKEVNIRLPFKENIYSIHVKREEAEKFLGYNFEEIRNDWDNTFSNKFVYSKEGRKEFFSKFGKIEKI